jgi:twitching motility protein PilT
MQLSVNLVGVISQTLVMTTDGKDRVAAFETLVGVPAVRSLIREGKTYQISSLIQTGMKQGMMTLDQSLANLVKAGQVKFEAAAERSQNFTDFRALCGMAEEAHPEAAAHHAPEPPPEHEPAEAASAQKKGPFGLRR